MKFSILVLASLSATFASAAMEVAVPDSLRGLRGTDDNGRELLAVKNIGDYFAVVGDGRCNDSAGFWYDAVKIKYETDENPMFRDCMLECLSKQCNKVVGIEDHWMPNGNRFCRCLYDDESIAGTFLEEGAFMDRRGSGPVNYADGSDEDIKCYRKRDDACRKFGGSNETGEGPWPSCVGETGKWCNEHILALDSELEVKLLRPGMTAPPKKENRVRVFLDKNGFVTRTPKRG